MCVLKSADANLFSDKTLLHTATVARAHSSFKQLFKIPRFFVTVFGTVFTVRYLRTMGYIKQLPMCASMGDLVKTQGEILSLKGEQYRVHYRTKIRRKYRTHVVGKTPVQNNGNGGVCCKNSVGKDGGVKAASESNVVTLKCEVNANKAANATVLKTVKADNVSRAAKGFNKGSQRRPRKTMYMNDYEINSNGARNISSNVKNVSKADDFSNDSGTKLNMNNTVSKNSSSKNSSSKNSNSKNNKSTNDQGSGDGGNRE